MGAEGFGGNGHRFDWRRGFSHSVGLGALENCCECGGPMRPVTRGEGTELVEVLSELCWPDEIEGMCPLGGAVCCCCGHVMVMVWGRGGGLVWCPGFSLSIKPGRTL